MAESTAHNSKVFDAGIERFVAGPGTPLKESKGGAILMVRTAQCPAPFVVTVVDDNKFVSVHFLF